MKNINMSIVSWFHKVFIILKMYVALINCNWSKAPSKAAWNNGLMVLITAQLGVARPDWGPKEVRNITPGTHPHLGKLGWRHVLHMMHFYTTILIDALLLLRLNEESGHRLDIKTVFQAYRFPLYRWDGGDTALCL